MPIRWREQMTVDGGIIDQDHKHLIEIINRFEEVAADGLTRDEALEILYSLRFYAATHFEREEKIQQLVDYPFRDSHHKEHADLIAALEDIISSLKTGEHDDDEASRIRINELLRSWLLDHILNSDIRLTRYVEGFKEGDLGIGALKDVEYVLRQS